MISQIFPIFSLILSLQNISEDVNFLHYERKNMPAIHAIWDIMLSRSVGAMTKKLGTTYIMNGYNPFQKAKNDDFILMNLESPFSIYDRDTNESSFYFASNSKNIEIIKWLTKGKNGIISLANNHIFNANFEGFRTTIKTLDEAKILHTGLSVWERKKFLEITKNNRKFCFGVYTYDGRKYFDKKSNETWYVNSLDDAKNDILDMKKSLCDEKIFMLHWGREYKFDPTENQQNLAHFLVDHGATLIIGAHSHIFGKMEKYREKIIFYSLGNAIFDQEWGREKCEPNMDCIFDEKIWKSVVPTHIGTAAHLDFPYKEAKISHWDIKIGKMIRRD